MDLEYKIQMGDNKALITLEGDMDDEIAGEALRKAFNRVFDAGHRTVVLDLRNVQIINSYGIGKILMCYKRLKAENGALLLKPLTGNVREVFELLMLDSLFPVDKDEA